MPTYNLQGNSIEVRRDAILVDTNVLVKGFHEENNNTAYIQYFLNEENHQILIPIAVVVEAWGFIVGSRKNWAGGYNLLSWLITPGKEIILIPQQAKCEDEHSLINRIQLDFVDAIIYIMADEISVKCNLSPPISVATYDTTDFYKLKRYMPDLRVELYQDLPFD